MTVSEKAWEEYISRMRGVNAAVSEQVQQYLENNIIQYDFDRRAAVRYIHALVTKYSEAAAALSCQMYDALGGLSSTLRQIPEAEPAEGPTYEDTARMVYKTLETGNPKTVGDAAARLVKRRAVDTTMQNAIRDGAEWAWIPHGDTCAFCITLASRGWQKASKKALKNGHADHIHDHCDCTYAVRFDNDTTVEGYDPEKYRAMYDAAEGGTPTEKINAMRRADYAQHKDEINAQKRAAYAERVERSEKNYTLSSGSGGDKIRNSSGNGSRNGNHHVFRNSDLPNGLPIQSEPYSIADKVDDAGGVLQRRYYGKDGMAETDFDTTDHHMPTAHPTGAHKHIFDYSKRNPHGPALFLTDEDLENNKDIIQRGINYHDSE
jgi:hypothetical protein